MTHQTTTTIQDLHRARLLSALRAKQGRTTDLVFTRRLGVPPRALSAARDGTRSIGIPLLAALVRAYPELEQVARTYLWALVDAEYQS
jgi:hypothetical protein